MEPTTFDPTRLEARIARLLVVGTSTGVALLAVGILLMIGGGIDPQTAAASSFDPAAIAGDVVALRPAGFLWLGLLVVMALPVTRVAIAAGGFAVAGERRMALIAVTVIAVLAISVVVVQVQGA